MAKRIRRGSELRRAQKRKRREQKRDEKLRRRKKALKARADQSFLESEYNKYKSRPLLDTSYRTNHFIFALVALTISASIWWGGIIAFPVFFIAASVIMIVTLASYAGAHSKYKMLASKRGGYRRLLIKENVRPSKNDAPARDKEEAKEAIPEAKLLPVPRPQKDALSAPSGQPFVVSSFED